MSTVFTLPVCNWPHFCVFARLLSRLPFDSLRPCWYLKHRTSSRPTVSLSSQWEDPARYDHDYCKMSRAEDVQDDRSQCDETEYFKTTQMLCSTLVYPSKHLTSLCQQWMDMLAMHFTMPMQDCNGLTLGMTRPCNRCSEQTVSYMTVHGSCR